MVKARGAPFQPVRAAWTLSAAGWPVQPILREGAFVMTRPLPAMGALGLSRAVAASAREVHHPVGDRPYGAMVSNEFWTQNAEAVGSLSRESYGFNKEIGCTGPNRIGVRLLTCLGTFANTVRSAGQGAARKQNDMPRRWLQSAD